MVNFDEIFERIKLATNTKTQMELAEVLDIRQSSISDAKRRNSVPSDWYMKLFENFGLNPDWLKKGMGPMYLRTDEGYAPVDAPGDSAAMHLYENAMQYNDPDAKSIVITVYSAQAPYNVEQPAPSIGKLSIPMSFAHSGLYTVRIESSGMEPQIRRGAYVGLDTTQKGVVSGEMYGVNLPVEGVALKRVYLDAVKQCVILRSENPNHPEAVLPVEEYRQLVVGRVSWVLQRV